MDRNLFQSLAYDVDAAESGASSQFEAEPEDGYESEGEEFVYTLPHDEDLPDEDPASDEEYILTELGPDEPSTSNGAEVGDMTTYGVPVAEQPIQIGNTDRYKVFKSKVWH
jgi:hypothetical protein